MKKKLPVVENPRVFLANLQAEALKTTEKVKELYGQMLSTLGAFEASGTTVLFRKEALYIEGRNNRGDIIINGVEIIAIPWDNNCRDKKIHCMVGLKIRFDIEYDRERGRRFFGDDKKPEWEESVYGFVMTYYVNKKKRYGRISKANQTSEEEMSIDNYAHFKMLKRLLLKACKEIGIAG